MQLPFSRAIVAALHRGYGSPRNKPIISVTAANLAGYGIQQKL